MHTHLKNFIAATSLILFLSIGLNASVRSKMETVSIKTSAICESCKARIEKALKSTDGITEANLNLNNKKVKVKYDPAKITAEQIRVVVANTGYDADETKKNAEAYNKLPHCCQSGSCSGSAACEKH